MFRNRPDRTVKGVVLRMKRKVPYVLRTKIRKVKETINRFESQQLGIREDGSDDLIKTLTYALELEQRFDWQT